MFNKNIAKVSYFCGICLIKAAVSDVSCPAAFCQCYVNWITTYSVSKTHPQQPGLQKLEVLICNNGLWHVSATQWVGLGLWVRCVSYVGLHENYVLYACQTHAYHMHAKVGSFCVSIARVFVFIRCTSYTDFHETIFGLTNVCPLNESQFTYIFFFIIYFL